METSGLFHYSPGFRDNGDLKALSLLTRTRDRGDLKALSLLTRTRDRGDLRTFSLLTRTRDRGDLRALTLLTRARDFGEPRALSLLTRIKDSHALVTCKERPEQRKEQLLTVSVLKPQIVFCQGIIYHCLFFLSEH